MKRCDVRLTSHPDPGVKKHVALASVCAQQKHAGSAIPLSCCDELCHMQGDSWQLVAELYKLEVIHQVLASGYSALYTELDTVFFRNPMQHLLSLQVCRHQGPCSLGSKEGDGLRLLLSSDPESSYIARIDAATGIQMRPVGGDGQNALSVHTAAA